MNGLAHVVQLAAQRCTQAGAGVGLMGIHNVAPVTQGTAFH